MQKLKSIKIGIIFTLVMMAFTLESFSCVHYAEDAIESFDKPNVECQYKELKYSNRI